MSRTLDLKPKWRARLEELLGRHLPDAEVWAYGSRVTGGGHDASDLDLVVRSPGDLSRPQKNLAELREALTESDLPILVDVLDWALIPESFRREIEKAYSVIQGPGASKTGAKK